MTKDDYRKLKEENQRVPECRLGSTAHKFANWKKRVHACFIIQVMTRFFWNVYLVALTKRYKKYLLQQ